MTNGSKTYSIIKKAVAISAFCVLSQGAMAQITPIDEQGPGPSVSVPVPATLALVGLGIAGLVATRRNKRK